MMEPVPASDQGSTVVELQPEEQLRYARWLDVGARAGLLLLIVCFVAYSSGFMPPHIAHDRLPQLWTLPVEAFVSAAELPVGWNWIFVAHRGDMASLIGIALLSSCSVPCLLALLPLYAQGRNYVYFLICTAEVVVLLLAASGVLTAGH